MIRRLAYATTCAALLFAGCKEQEQPQMDPRIPVFDPSRQSAAKPPPKAPEPPPTPVSDGKERVTLRWKVESGKPVLVRAAWSPVSGGGLDPALAASGAAVDVASTVEGAAKGRGIVASLEPLGSGDFAVRAKNDGARADASSPFGLAAQALEKDGKVRATMTGRGFITSDVDPAVRNLLAVFLELPSDAVAVGDVWRSSADLLDTPETFIQTAGKKRADVKLAAIEEADGKKVAVLEYVLAESTDGKSTGEGAAQASAAAAFVGVGRFVIDEGRWASFEGRAVTTGSGSLKRASDERLSLSFSAEVPEDLLKDPPPKVVAASDHDDHGHGGDHGHPHDELVLPPTPELMRKAAAGEIEFDDKGRPINLMETKSSKKKK